MMSASHFLPEHIVYYDVQILLCKSNINKIFITNFVTEICMLYNTNYST